MKMKDRVGIVASSFWLMAVVYMAQPWNRFAATPYQDIFLVGVLPLAVYWAIRFVTAGAGQGESEEG